jgi:hypothetical protein
MKLVTTVLVLVFLSACRTRPAESPEPILAPLPADEAATLVDFSALQGKSMTVEEFVRVCQRLSGFNFTYTETTAEAMGTTSLRLAGPDRVPVPEFGNFLDAQLQGCGFTCERIGPEHLRVFLVQTRAM